MFCRYFKSTLLFLLVFSLNSFSSPVNLSHVVYVKHTEKPAHTTSISKASDRHTTLGLLMGDSNPAHVSAQNYRPSHLLKQAVIFSNLVVVADNCSKYISRSSQLSFSRFRKLVLFPFHAFW